LPLRRGDILVVRTNGNPNLCGQAAVVEDLEGSWAFASYLLRLRTDPERLDPTFLWLYLRSASGRRQLGGSIRTSAGNFNLSAEGLSSLHVPLPPLEEQKRIVETAKAIGRSIDAHEAELGRLRTLKISVANALLSGRLRVNLGAES